MDNNRMTKISIIGAGAWGTSLAQIYATSNHNVTLWTREASLCDQLNKTRVNETYLPNFKLDNKIHITNSLTETFDRSDIILNVIPAQFVRPITEQFKSHIKPHHHLIVCAKGIEISSGHLLTDVVKSILPDSSVGILTGPTFAHDLMAGKPSAATLAHSHETVLNHLSQSLTSKQFRLYTTHDIVGAQVGGAVKNVIAIACGIVDGLQLGESARAALVTRGLAEMARLAVALGGERDTLMGQCGVGDLMLTCSSIQSRNYSFGLRIGKGETAHDILKDRKAVTEGVTTAKALKTLSQTL
jgi:glycerol-3-phosphate dehydrogenase (NAD(P)+)